MKTIHMKNENTIKTHDKNRVDTRGVTGSDSGHYKVESTDKVYDTEKDANRYAEANSYTDHPINVHYNYRNSNFVVTIDGPGADEKRIGRYHHGRKTYEI